MRMATTSASVTRLRFTWPMPPEMSQTTTNTTAMPSTVSRIFGTRGWWSFGSGGARRDGERRRREAAGPVEEVRLERHGQPQEDRAQEGEGQAPQPADDRGRERVDDQQRERVDLEPELGQIGRASCRE